MSTFPPQTSFLATDYHRLSPDLILDAIESIGIYPETGLLPLNSYENRVYQFRCDRNQRYVAKFYRPQRWSDAQILEEHEFSKQLQAAEIPIASPSLIAQQSLHHYQGYRFALFPSLGGRAFDPENFDQLEQVGHFLGRMHQLGQAQSFTHRIALTPETYGRQALSHLQQSPYLPAHLQAEFMDSAAKMLEDIEQIWQQYPATMIRTHGDLHLGNLLETPDGIGFVDLDDACIAPAVQDLWMLLSGDRQQQLLQLDCLLDSYQEFCDFDATELHLIEPLRGLRLLHHCAWLSRRWDDPSFPPAFPWFVEDHYWQQQINDFKEQRIKFTEPALQLSLY